MAFDQCFFFSPIIVLTFRQNGFLTNSKLKFTLKTVLLYKFIIGKVKTSIRFKSLIFITYYDNIPIKKEDGCIVC